MTIIILIQLACVRTETLLIFPLPKVEVTLLIYWFDFFIIIIIWTKVILLGFFIFIFYYSLTILDTIGLVISHIVNTVNYLYKTG